MIANRRQWLPQDGLNGSKVKYFLPRCPPDFLFQVCQSTWFACFQFFSQVILNQCLVGERANITEYCHVGTIHEQVCIFCVRHTRTWLRGRFLKTSTRRSRFSHRPFWAPAKPCVLGFISPHLLRGHNQHVSKSTVFRPRTTRIKILRQSRTERGQLPIQLTQNVGSCQSD